MKNPYISDLKLPTNYIEKVIADIDIDVDNDVYSDSIVKLDVNSIKIGTVLGLHAIIKCDVKVTSAVLLTLCDIQRAANNIKCTATNISRAIEKCKKLRGAKKIDFFTETFKLSPSIVNRDCEVSYDKTVNGTVTPDVQKEVPKNAAEPKAKSTKFSLKPTSEPEVNYISLSTDDWVAVAFENMWYIGNNYHHIPSSLDL